MHRWLGCVLLLLVTTTNTAGAEDEMTEIRAALRSMRLETGAALQAIRLELDVAKMENTALSARLRAVEPATMADPTDATISDDATISNDERDSNSARRLTEQGGKASIDFDGHQLRITSPLHVNGSFTAAGAISGASVSASGAVSGATLTTTGAVMVGADLSASGAVSSASVTASGAVSGASVTASGTVSGMSVTVSGAVSGASVTASGTVSGNSLTSTGAVTVGGDLTVSGNIYRSTVIAFSAIGQSGGTNIVSATNILPFNDIKVNLGSAYSASTYTFTAPVDGVYQFSVFLCSRGAHSKIEFLINGAWDGVRSYGAAFYAGQGFTVIRQLSAGGTVKPYVVGADVSMHDSISVSTFSGFLIAAT